MYIKNKEITYQLVIVVKLGLFGLDANDLKFYVELQFFVGITS